MATIINNYIWTVSNNVTTINLFNDLRTMPGVTQAVGDDNDMIFKIGENILIEFINWDSSGTLSENARKIYVRYNGVATQIYSEQSSDWSPVQRMYQLVKSKNNDWTLQVGVGQYTKTSFNDVSAIFAVVNVQNTSTQDVGYGIYIPFSQRQQLNGICQNAPKYLITEDVTEDIPNNDTGLANSTLRYIMTSIAKLTTLIPICAISSMCVSTTAYVMMIGQRPIYGDATLNNSKYYCIDGLCLLDE